MNVTVHEDADALEQLKASIRTFLDRNASREAVASLEGSEAGFSAQQWKDLGRIGCLALLMPERYGGGTAGVRTMAAVIELLATRGLPTPIFPTAVDAALLISLAGTAKQQEQLLPALAAGDEVMTVALHEPGADQPSQPGDVATRAEETPSGWRLDGTKLFVSHLNSSRRLLCVARTAGDQIRVFLVPAGAPGLTSTRLETSNGDPLFALRLGSVEVAGDASLGDGRDCWPAVARTLDVGAALKSAELLGFGRRALELTADFSRVRVQFDQPIGAFQAVQHHLADMYRVLEQTRVLLDQAVTLLDTEMPAAREVSLAKVKAAEGMLFVLNMAQQVHGGVGYYTDYPLETFFRRVMAAQGAYGSARWHRRRLGNLLCDSPDRFRRPGAHDLNVVAPWAASGGTEQ